MTLTNFLSNTVKANSIPTVTYEMVGKDNSSAGILEAPDFSSIAFRSLGSFSESGTISDEYNSYTGYSLGRQWHKGDVVIDILKLGDINDSFGVGRFRLGEIVAKPDRQLQDVTLDRFEFIKNQTIGSFIQANPQLKERVIKDVPPLADAVAKLAEGIALMYGDRGKALSELPVKVLIGGDRNSPIIDFNYLLTKVSQINKASVRASESIQAMRNNAWFAKPASKPDTSPFKLPEEALLGGG